MAHTSLAIAAATRPYPGQLANGDAWQVDWHADRCRIAVIDGLGHGPEAAAAANAAREVLARHADLAPDEGLRACHAALASTRGAAISIAAIEPATSRLVYAGVGNVDARLWQAGRQQRLVAYRGIVGMALPTIHTFAFSLQPEWVLLMHTDGVSTRFSVPALPPHILAEAQPLADCILEGWGRMTDDATVVVVRPGCPSCVGRAIRRPGPALALRCFEKPSPAPERL